VSNHPIQYRLHITRGLGLLAAVGCILLFTTQGQKLSIGVLVIGIFIGSLVSGIVSFVLRWINQEPDNNKSLTELDLGHDSAENIHGRVRRMPNARWRQNSHIDAREVNRLPSDGMAHPHDERD